MDNLQYSNKELQLEEYYNIPRFKPYYKWITFNTIENYLQK